MLLLGSWRHRIFLLWLFYIHRLSLYFETPYVVCSSNIDDASVFKVFDCRLLLRIFVASSIFLILPWFLNSRFFVISVTSSGLYLLYIEMYAKGSTLLCFGRFIVLLMAFFLLIRMPNLFVLLNIPSGRGSRVILLDEFVEVFVSNSVTYSTCWDVRMDFI